jgi:Tfp pilus assembly protein PilN
MANINLISARRAERVRLTKVARGLAVALLASGVLSAGAVMFMLTRFVMAKQRVAQAESRLAVLRPILEEIEAAEQERRDLQPKLVTLTDAQKSTNRWFGIMEGLKRVVPEQTWLTNLSVEGNPETGRIIRVNGISNNQSRVGETMYRLTQQPEYYSKVDLRFTRTTQVETRENVEFELAATLYQPEQPKAEEGDATQTN